MPKPLCPNCHERMSSVEAGLCGVWSCIYCDGVWLPASEVGALASKAGVNVHAIKWPSVVGQGATLQCPACDGASFAPITVDSHTIHICTECHSLYLPKASVQPLSTHLNTTRWFSRESFSKQNIDSAIAYEIAFDVVVLALMALTS